jgi:hypothetical protein
MESQECSTAEDNAASAAILSEPAGLTRWRRVSKLAEREFWDSVLVSYELEEAKL